MKKKGLLGLIVGGTIAVVAGTAAYLCGRNNDENTEDNFDDEGFEDEDIVEEFEEKEEEKTE